MSRFMARKEVTHCLRCGAEFGNGVEKYPKRARCRKCVLEEAREIAAIKKSQQPKFADIFSDFMNGNRDNHWKEVNKQLTKIKDREESKLFIQRRFEEVMEDKLVWQYINRETQYQNKKKRNGKH